MREEVKKKRRRLLASMAGVSSAVWPPIWAHHNPQLRPSTSQNDDTTPSIIGFLTFQTEQNLKPSTTRLFLRLSRGLVIQ